jgi:hypothetical protein
VRARILTNKGESLAHLLSRSQPFGPRSVQRE